MFVADGLVPLWRHDICNNHDIIDRSLYVMLIGFEVIAPYNLITTLIYIPVDP